MARDGHSGFEATFRIVSYTRSADRGHRLPFGDHAAWSMNPRHPDHGSRVGVPAYQEARQEPPADVSALGWPEVNTRAAEHKAT
jgi:hypothetical protein